MGFFDLFKKKQRQCTLVGSTLTVVLTNKSNTTLVFEGATKKDFNFISDKNLEDVDVMVFYQQYIKDRETVPAAHIPLKQMIEGKEQKKKEEEKRIEEVINKQKSVKEITDRYPSLIKTGDFKVSEGSVYLTAVPSLSIPPLLVERFIEVVKDIDKSEEALDEYVSLIRFWLWCTLNPNPESRENLFKYIKNQKLKINKYGFFVSYRRVLSAGKVIEDGEEVEESKPDKHKSEEISKLFLKIKTQKKGPKNFWVIEDANGNLSTSKTEEVDESWVVLGNLANLYEALHLSSSIETSTVPIEVQTYTDSHTRSMDIRIGKEVSIDPAKCDWSNKQSCSSGLSV